MKHMIKMACEKKALDYLNDQKMKHSKVQHINHTKWETQPYLLPTSMAIEDSKLILMIRSRMLDGTFSDLAYNVNFYNLARIVNNSLIGYQFLQNKDQIPKRRTIFLILILIRTFA